MTEVDGVDKHSEVFLAPRPVSFLLPRLVSPALILCGAVIATATDTSIRDKPVGVVLLVVVALAMTILPIYFFMKARAQPWAVRIGTDGVTWHDTQYQLAWSAVAEVRVGARGKLRALLRPGVRLIDRRQADFAERAGSRPTGHLIDTRYLAASPEEVLKAIAQFATLPIVQE